MGCEDQFKRQMSRQVAQLGKDWPNCKHSLRSKAYTDQQKASRVQTRVLGAVASASAIGYTVSVIIIAEINASQEDKSNEKTTAGVKPKAKT